jgi:hypothetical protein
MLRFAAGTHLTRARQEQEIGVVAIAAQRRNFAQCNLMQGRITAQSKDPVSRLYQRAAHRYRVAAHLLQFEFAYLDPQRRPVPSEYFPCAGEDQRFRALDVNLDEVNPAPPGSLYHAVKSMRLHVYARRCELMVARMIGVYLKLRHALAVRYNGAVFRQSRSR